MVEPFESGSIVIVPKPDGTTEYWELTDGWHLLRTETNAPLLHTHSTLENLEITGVAKFTGSVYTEDKKGENATVIIPGVGTLKFKHGIMHQFIPV